jgi:hypothetical protein
MARTEAKAVAEGGEGGRVPREAWNPNPNPKPLEAWNEARARGSAPALPATPPPAAPPPAAPPVGARKAASGEATEVEVAVTEAVVGVSAPEAAAPPAPAETAPPHTPVGAAPPPAAPPHTPVGAAPPPAPAQSAQRVPHLLASLRANPLSRAVAASAVPVPLPPSAPPSFTVNNPLVAAALLAVRQPAQGRRLPHLQNR